MLVRWCSLRVVLPGALLIALLAIMHFIFAPLVPTFVMFNAPGLKHRGGGVIQRALACKEDHAIFRNATWRSEVGCWLSQCAESATPVPVVERISTTRCKLGCRGRGVCNEELGRCQCFVGFSGASCEVELLRECNKYVSKEAPYGRWGVSICPGFCDKSMAHCLCGNNTKYPGRPLAEACGFRLMEDHMMVDWTKADIDNIFGNGSYKGWCNLDAVDVYEGKYRVKQPQCDCTYDGRAGAVCEIPTESFCINQCNNNGLCREGFCDCKEGWYGVDCSVPSILPPHDQLPNWMLPAATEVSSDAAQQTTVPATFAKKRPLIYVYDLPTEYTSQLLQGRHSKFNCVNRLYDAYNRTFWTDKLYGAEVAMYESLLASEHRTTNGNEADFFYVPVLHACATEQADAAPYMNMQGHYMGLRQFYAGDFSKRAFQYVQENYPYWNRTAGQDHIWFFPWDEGACAAPKEIWNSMMLTHWGNTNSKYKMSTTAYGADSWNNIPPEWRGDHTCYDPSKDLVIPAWKYPDPVALQQNFWARPRQDRPTLFYFNGNLGSAYKNGRPEADYSMGIRQRLAAEFGSEPDKNGKRGRYVADDVVVKAQRSNDYKLELSKSRFCGVFPGDGWSGRLEDSVLHGCIPVIIQDGIHLPFENVLDYKSLAVRIAEDDLPNLVTILRAINDTEVEAKLAAVRSSWPRFTYQRAVKLEAQRQKLQGKVEEAWATENRRITGDDAFSTFIQVLLFKLYNDEWRKELKVDLKHHGIVDKCR